MKSERAVLIEIRLEAPKLEVELFRNNSGVFIDLRGVPVRFGLANDSARLNKHIKSSDVIGLMPPNGRFVAIECKREGWKWTGTDEEIAQERFLHIIRQAGGIGAFCSSVEEFRAVMSQF